MFGEIYLHRAAERRQSGLRSLLCSRVFGSREAADRSFALLLLCIFLGAKSVGRAEFAKLEKLERGCRECAGRCRVNSQGGVIERRWEGTAAQHTATTKIRVRRKRGEETRG